jgi:ectoine hydroxylase-related dioxygenase (phytanoyl-CoA dioxygenase family)
VILSTEQRAAFAENGWLVIRGAVEPARVKALEAALDAVVPETHYAVGYAGRILEIASVSRGSAALLEHAHDRRIAALAAAALDVPRVRYFQDTVFLKPGSGGGGVDWHQDYTYFTFLDRPAALTVRLALTPCTRANGCLRVVSGSHRWGLCGDGLTFVADHVVSAVETLAPEQQARVNDDHVTLELEPGDLSIHHCLTFHGSHENPSARPRKTLAVRLVDGDARLVPGRLPSPEMAAYFPTDADGLLAERAFPLLHDERS